jgi:(p)ppGpp synthase/HD superfamily hydrolase
MTSILTARFEDALVFTTHLHAQQYRKGSQIPYIAHLLSVSALVIEAGGDEDLAIAALLHDAVEDQGGLETLVKIRQRFGKRVADIVDSCSDSYTMPKPAWKTRKENYLDKLQTSSQEVRLVSLADKLHNARNTLRDLRKENEMVWDKFNGGKTGTLWYYRSLIEIFEQYEGNFLLNELKRVINQIEIFAPS